MGSPPATTSCGNRIGNQHRPVSAHEHPAEEPGVGVEPEELGGDAPTVAWQAEKPEAPPAKKRVAAKKVVAKKVATKKVAAKKAPAKKAAKKASK